MEEMDERHALDLAMHKSQVLEKSLRDMAEAATRATLKEPTRLISIAV